jgi:peptidoglycan/LPS O-acetylase OafA/YrhL
MPALEGLRAIFAIGIVAFHAWMFSHHSGDRLAGQVIGELRIGVVLFFTLSGFLLWRARAAGLPFRLRAFALGRATRILPLYWLTLAASAALLAGTGYARAAEPHEVPALVLLLQNYWELDGLLNPPTWTLVVEVSFYVAVPLLAWLACRIGTGRATRVAVPAGAIGVGLVYCAVWQWAGWERHWLATLPGCLTYFAAGMLAAAVVAERRPGPPAARLALAAGVAVVAVNAIWHARVGAPGQGIWRDTLAGLGFAAIIVAVGPGGRARWLAWRPLQALGRWSYGVYLWHFVVMMAFLSRGAWPERFWPGLAILLVSSVPLAALTYRFVERPAIAWSRRWHGRQRPATAAAGLAATA